MQVLAHTKLTSAQASIEFTGISQEFDDLLLVVSPKTSYTAFGYDGLFIRFNSTTSGYSFRYLLGSGTGVATDTSGYGISTTYGWIGSANASASSATNTFSSHSVLIPNYKSSTAKSYSADASQENNGTEAYNGITAGLWNNSSAITQITIHAPANSANFVANSSMTLYGIKRGSDGITTVT